MNLKQKVALWVGVAVLVLMLLFPPWEMRGVTGTPNAMLSVTIPLPSDVGVYHPLWSPPDAVKPTGVHAGFVSLHVNIVVLSIQSIIVALITAAAICSLTDRRKES